MARSAIIVSALPTGTGGETRIIPDEKGGVWLLHRSDPPLLHIDAAGNVVKTMAEGMFGTVHAFCRDRDGNFWAGDSGPFNAAKESLRGPQVQP